MWLDRVKEVYGDNLDIRWRNFQLEQVNHKEGPDWKVWEQSDVRDARSLLSAIASEAARRQNSEAWGKFHLALLTARHGDETRIPLNEEGPILELAEGAGLDVGRLKEDMKDGSLVRIVADDHTEATEKHGAFGTPTFVFETGNSVYLKTFIPPAEDSVAFFEHFVALSANRSFLGELKRPQPPWPKGAVS